MWETRIDENRSVNTQTSLFTASLHVLKRQSSRNIDGRNFLWLGILNTSIRVRVMTAVSLHHWYVYVYLCMCERMTNSSEFLIHLESTAGLLKSKAGLTDHDSNTSTWREVRITSLKIFSLIYPSAAQSLAGHVPLVCWVFVVTEGYVTFGFFSLPKYLFLQLRLLAITVFCHSI